MQLLEILSLYAYYVLVITNSYNYFAWLYKRLALLFLFDDKSYLYVNLNCLLVEELLTMSNTKFSKGII